MQQLIWEMGCQFLLTDISCLFVTVTGYCNDNIRGRDFVAVSISTSSLLSRWALLKSKCSQGVVLLEVPPEQDTWPSGDSVSCAASICQQQKIKQSACDRDCIRLLSAAFKYTENVLRSAASPSQPWGHSGSRNSCSCSGLNSALCCIGNKNHWDLLSAIYCKAPT